MIIRILVVEQVVLFCYFCLASMHHSLRLCMLSPSTSENRWCARCTHHPMPSRPRGPPLVTAGYPSARTGKMRVIIYTHPDDAEIRQMLFLCYIQKHIYIYIYICTQIIRIYPTRSTARRSVGRASEVFSVEDQALGIHPCIQYMEDLRECV